MDQVLRIALSKGRILDEALPLLSAAGLAPREDPRQSRRLILDTQCEGVQLVIIRAVDVPTFVEYGAAALGVAGKDILLEHGGRGLYEPLDLKIARCRLVVAGLNSAAVQGQRLRIATKYVQITHRHYAHQDRQVEIIKLYGSMELAPIVGLADAIVDLVDTGNTLRANGLKVLEHITDISARLIVNKAALKMRHRQVTELIERIGRAVAA